MDREKVIKALEFCTDQRIVDTCYGGCPYAVADDEYKCLQMKLDALSLLKEQEGLMLALGQSNAANEYLNAEVERLTGLLKEKEPIKPTINEYGKAYCVCGENVGIIPNSNNLPKIRSKYCSECGRRMKWE